jgi:hypothetical protein
MVEETLQSLFGSGLYTLHWRLCNTDTRHSHQYSGCGGLELWVAAAAFVCGAMVEPHPGIRLVAANN